MEVIIVSTSPVCYEDLMCCWRGFCCSQLIKSILAMAERKGAFNQNAFKMADSAIWQIWRDGGLSVPQKPPLKFLLNPETLKGNEEEILDIRWDGGHSCHHLPLYADCVQACWSSSGCYLVHKIRSHSLSGRLLKGTLWKRSGHLLVTYSSCLFHWLMEIIEKLGKVSCD